MKYRPKAYAQALVDSLLDKKNDDKDIAANFLKLLEKNGDIKKAGQIILLAEGLMLKKNGNKKVVLETARKADIKEAIRKFAKKGDMVTEKINPKLIAGVRIIIDNNIQLDLSLAKKLENIF